MATPEVAAALADLQAGYAADGAALVAWAEAHTRTGQTIARLVDLLGEPDHWPGVELVVGAVTTSTIEVRWTVGVPEPAGWTVGRDGSDTLGSGPWVTPEPLTPDRRSFTFRSLRPATEYILTLTPTGGPAVSVKATTGRTSPGPGPGATTAAERYGWGVPHPVSDEFDYTGQPDPMKWILPGPGWAGHAGRGRRLAERTTVRDGMMVLTALPNGDAGWVRQRMPTRYGRWELQARCRTTSPGVPWHVLALIWPTRENWPRSGELDFLEIEDPNQGFFRAYLHYPHPTMPVQQEIVTVGGVDPREMHCYGFEWTPDGVAGFIDGEEIYRLRGGGGPAGRSDIQAMPEGSLTLQLDHFSSNSHCTYEIQWVRFYPLPGRTQ